MLRNIQTHYVALLLVLSFTASPPSFSYAQEIDSIRHLGFKYLDIPQLDTIGEVRGIAQDSLGFVWFAGGNGLARYDGYDIKIYLTNPKFSGSISTNTINDVMLDKNGRLWVASYWGLNLYIPEQDRFEYFIYDVNKPNSLSDNSVISLLQTGDGSLWLATSGGLNRFRPETWDFERVVHDNENPDSIPSNLITSIAEDSQGNLLLGTLDKGLVRYNPKTKRVTHHYSQENGLAANMIRAVKQDQTGDVWVATGSEGVDRIDLNRNTIHHYDWLDKCPTCLVSANITDIHLTPNGQLWFSGGIQEASVYNRARDNFIRIKNNGHVERAITRSIFHDASGAVWMGLSPSGVIRTDRYRSAFRNYQNEPGNPNSLSHTHVVSIVEDKEQDLWIGTRDGLTFFERPDNNEQQEKFKWYLDESDDPDASQDQYSLAYDNVSSLALSGDGSEVWIGTAWFGVYIFDQSTKQFRHLGSEPDNPNSLAHREIWSVFRDSFDQIWVGTNRGGLHRYRPETNDFQRILLRPERQESGRTLVIYEDSQQTLWIGSDDGLFATQLTGHNDGDSIQRFDPHSTHTIKLSIPIVLSILEDRNGNMFFGTEGGGVNIWYREEDRYVVYTQIDGLAHNSVVSMLEDESGYIWMATGNGISRFSPDTKKFRTYTKQHGLPGNHYESTAALKTQRGELVFGNANGLSIITPNLLFENALPSKLVITDVLVFNTPLSLSDPEAKALLTNAPPYNDTLTLDHTQSVFSFQFSLLNYDIPSLNTYAYKLEGFDENWNHIGTRRMATYTNLDPGHYRFKVKGANNEGVWSENIAEMTVIILPPWWQSVWAKLFYLCLAVALLGLIGFTYLQQKRAKDEQQLNHKLRDLDKIKDEFLANTSHELRTPLNGIIGLSESLIDGVSGPMNDDAAENLQLIVSSGKRLAYLIDDILDFSKLKQHSITLTLSPINLHSLCTTIIRLTQPLIDRKAVTLNNQVEPELNGLQADEKRLQQILYNLVGNAIKFTEVGEICISTKVEQEYLWVSVSDTGSGISKDQLTKVFLAFEQADDAKNQQPHGHLGGTGLGLNVTKKLVELHGGNIKIASHLGKGTVVRFSLPMSGKIQTKKPKTEATNKDTIINPLSESLRKTPNTHSNKTSNTRVASTTPIKITHDPSINHSDANASLNEEDTVVQYHILVVDDEPINRRVLVNLLSLKDYRISECVSGQEALQFMLSDEPPHNPRVDLLLLDVMMPGISGYSVCRELRQHYSASVLPVIFLTAKSQISDLQEGYASGGSDFLTKPMVKEELFARMSAHLSQAHIHKRIENAVQSRTAQLAQAYDHLKATQTQLVQAEKMSSLGTLVAGVGHEINNPANFISLANNNAIEQLKSFRELLHSLISDGEEEVLNSFNEYFDIILDQLLTAKDGSQRISKIVGNLRTFSRSSARREEAAVPMPARLAIGLQSTLQLVQANYNDKITFNIEVLDDPELLCDTSELNQVFMNMMVNACQAMQSNQQVNHVNTPEVMNNKSKHCLQIRMKKQNDTLTVSFKDNGCGMSSATIDKIFEPFFTTKGSGEGTGLGMSISYGIIERHKGHISVDSILNEGSELVIHLPLN
ncbi:MAG: hypothetical protein COA42_02120 [Alteromonadaceae bacterium]|nr:MAG: hypothetical protein COA42_02120 [Alteromonadaceae bacterium]